MDAQDMEGSTGAALPLETRTSTTDSAKSPFEDSSNTHMKNDGESSLDSTTELQNTVNEVENQSESMKNPLHTVFSGKNLGANFCNDLEGQSHIPTGSDEASPLHTSIDQASQDLQAQEDELRELGIDVVDQVSLERRVEAAVSRKPLLIPFMILCS